eukprot:6281690-Amphidinium_carterae.2
MQPEARTQRHRRRRPPAKNAFLHLCMCGEERGNHTCAKPVALGSQVDHMSRVVLHDRQCDRNVIGWVSFAQRSGTSIDC